jgi:protein-L-isoaspartate(D-aspartate) O-methyltransferase
MERLELIKDLLNEGVLQNSRVLSAFKEVDRKDFVPGDLKNIAYENRPLTLEFGQTISQPYTVAFMLNLLEAKPGQKVLDVGFGSGWTTAMLSKIVGGKGKIFGLELFAEIYEFGQSNLEKYKQKNIKLFLGSGWDGLPDNAPYDRILVSASAGEIPQVLIGQIKVGGRLVMPLTDRITVLDKVGKSSFEIKDHWGFVFVPLIKAK